MNQGMLISFVWALFALPQALLAQAEPQSQSPSASVFGLPEQGPEEERGPAASPAPTPAPGPAAGAVTAEDTLADPVRVVGNRLRAVGSAHVVTKAELRAAQATDLHRVLYQIPGVSIQEEEGFGNRPNIGIRGTGVERSQKVTLMEDGILAAPAAYSASSTLR